MNLYRSVRASHALAFFSLLVLCLASFPSATFAGTTVIFLTSGTSWTVPSDWSLLNNTVEVIGGGGGGGGGTSDSVNVGGGGGGGAYGIVKNVQLTPGVSITYSIGGGGSGGAAGASGTAGGDTWFNGTSVSNATVSASGGGAGGEGTSGSGGSAHATYAGGSGGTFASGAAGATGGGGAAGPHGVGGAGGGSFASPNFYGSGGGGGNGGGSNGSNASNSSTGGGAGGNGQGGSGGGTAGAGSGGTPGNATAGSGGGGGGGGGNGPNNGSSAGPGGSGATGTEWDSSHGSGGGGGGGGSTNNCCASNSAAGGTAANYGGGGGGGGSNNPGNATVGGIGGRGAQGIIVITYASGITLTASTTVTGNASVLGVLSKSAGSFVIDDPLDPKNELLFHSFVESPDAMDVYDGTTTLDSRGDVTIQLPNYFLALNDDFRYLASPIDPAMPDLHLSAEVHREFFFGLFGPPVFSIAGGVPGGEISWQITGIRHDPFIEANPIIPEVEKGPGQLVGQNQYLFPQFYAPTQQ